MTTKYNGEQMTLNTLLEKYEVIVPIIQRDYAHGRIEETKIRNNFLETLYQALTPGGSPAVLDYIYGSMNEKTKRFLPIDGQQRLTTLYLLYWYFSIKEGNHKSYLRNFTYEVRDSATEFCEGLIKNTIILSEAPSDEIRNASWYHNAYEADPTVLSMLNMLDAIHERFNAVENGCAILESKAVSFWVLPLEGFGLTDDLFIKMNARGKRPSKFDIFKSEFEQKIDNVDLPNEQREEWKEKIDNDWLDFFWSEDHPGPSEGRLFRYILFISRTYRAKHENEYTSIEINNITEAEQKADINVLSEPDNFNFLIFALNNLSNIANNPFTKDAFDKIINGKIETSYPDRARLYALLQFRYRTGGSNKYFERVIKNLISGQRRIQKNRKQFESYITAATFGSFLRSTDIFVNESDKNKGVINALVNADLAGCNFYYLSFEKEKAHYFAPNGSVDNQKYKEIVSLESIPDLSGLIHCFFFNNKCWLSNVQVMAILNIAELKPTLLLRTLQAFANENILAPQFHGQWKELNLCPDPYGSHDECTYDRFYKHFLGCNVSDIWGDYLLSADFESPLCTAVRTFVQEISKLPFSNISLELEKLLKQRLATLNMNDERYYFAKYKEFYGDDSSSACVCVKSQYTSHHCYLRVFINRDAGMRGSLESGKHYNPYYKALSNLLQQNKSNIAMINQDTGVYYGGKFVHEWLRLDNGCSMRLRFHHDNNTRYWEVDTQKATAPILATALAMLENGKLVCSGSDCIEKACNFIMDM